MKRARFLVVPILCWALQGLVWVAPGIGAPQDSSDPPVPQEEKSADPQEAVQEATDESAATEPVSAESAEIEEEPIAEVSSAASSWSDRVEELSKQILFGKAEHTDVDELILELKPQLRAARDRLRDSIGSGASLETLNAHHEQMEDLYDARLLLLEEATPGYRVRTVGLGADGVVEAQEELDRLQLHMRYQGSRLPTYSQQMLRDLRTSPIPFLKGLVALVFALILFRAWRRWAEVTLPAMRQKLLKARPRTRRNLRVAKFVWYLDRLRTPVEWLILFLVVASVLRPADSFQDEDPVRLVIKWVFIGWAGLRLVDALVARGGAGMARDGKGLRLRTLRLIWGWIAAVGLARDLAAEYVGKGTLYSWVWWILVFAGIPLLFVLLHWWREEVFLRLAKESDLPSGQEKTLAEGGKRKGYIATALGGGFLIQRGLQRQFIRVFSTFDMGRRIQAHFFHREVERQANQRGGAEEGEPLPEHLRERILGGRKLVPKVYRADVKSIVKKAQEERGWSVALVGERGMGKTTFLSRLSSELGEGLLILDCPVGGFDRLLGSLREQLELPGTDGDDFAGLTDVLRQRGVEVLAVDNVHRLTAPRIGGFVDWNRVREMAQRLGPDFSWILTFDQVAFQYIKRIRADGAMTVQLLELPRWTEEQIEELLLVRAEEAGIELDYEQLELPRQLEEMTYGVEESRKRRGFMRLLRDSSHGNPGVALRIWRDLLIVADSGQIQVRLAPQLGVADLEDLSLTSQFVLRCIAQSEYASADEIAEALNLPRGDVDAALRAALARGLIEKQDGLMRITWTWFRPITRLLTRQNLLANK